MSTTAGFIIVYLMCPVRKCSLGHLPPHVHQIHHSLSAVKQRLGGQVLCAQEVAFQILSY